jgi:RNA polymerase sigma-70 factor (ECF subfamily)
MDRALYASPALLAPPSGPPAIADAVAASTDDAGDRRLDNAARAAGIEVLVTQHGDFVWRSLRRLGVPEPLVDDATQQVFMIACDKLDRIQPGSERSFLFSTLSNVAAHARRKLARGREQPYDELTEQAVDAAPLADDLVARRQARALLDIVLESLGEDLRAVFVLFELEELSVPEIAKIVGVPEGTASSRLRRAREEFQKAAKRVRAQGDGMKRGKP